VVYLEESTEVEAPLANLWAYLRSDDRAPAATRDGSVRWIDRQAVNDTQFLETGERRLDGAWTEFVTRTTMLAPVGLVLEEQEGLLAGTKQVVVLAAMGARTRVDRFGEYRSDRISEDRLPTTVRALEETAGQEAARALRGRPTLLPPEEAGCSICDEGSRFEAPIGVVWEYLVEGAVHDRVHQSTRNPKFEPLTHTAFVYSAERRVEEEWFPEAIRITVFQPIAIASEFLRGPFAGSKMIYVYKPRGAQTQIDVYGDFRSSTRSPTEVGTLARHMLETEFREDEPALRRFAAAKVRE
jgi:hypothetical protein